MAIYVCLAHDKPIRFRDSAGIYYHIVYDHRECFSRLPRNYYSGVREVDFREFVCRCGKTGFPTLRHLLIHLNKCQNVKIIYMKGLIDRRGYLNGISLERFERIAKKSITIKKAADILGLSNEIADYADKLSREFCRRAKVTRTSKVDAASLYVASIVMNNKVSQSEAARVFEASEPTVRKWYKAIIKELNIDIPY